MKKNIFKLIYITFISIICFCMFSSSIKANTYLDVAPIKNYSSVILIQNTNFHLENLISISEITCDNLKNTKVILKDVFKYVRIAAAVLFVILTSVDYASAILNGEQEFKTSNKRLVTRLIVLIVIMMLPSIINLILDLVQMKNGTCGIN